MEKVIRIVIETKGGFKFGYEKIEKSTRPEIEDRRNQLTYEGFRKGNEIDIYA